MNMTTANGIEYTLGIDDSIDLTIDDIQVNLTLEDLLDMLSLIDGDY